MKYTEVIVSVLFAIVGVSIFAVLVSPQARTTSVIGAFGNMFEGILATAVSPVTGSKAGVNAASGSGFGFGAGAASGGIGIPGLGGMGMGFTDPLSMLGGLGGLFSGGGGAGGMGGGMGPLGTI